MAENQATHFSNYVKFPLNVLETCDTTDWKAFLAKVHTTADLTFIPADHHGIIIHFKSALSLDTIHNGDISEVDALDSPMRLIAAVHKMVEELVEPFPDTAIPKVKIKEERLF